MLNCIGHILRRNWLLSQAIEGKIEGRIKVRGRGGRRRKQPLDHLKETKGYWKLKAEALDRILWRTSFGRGCGPVVRQTAEWMNEWMTSGRTLKADIIKMTASVTRLYTVLYFHSYGIIQGTGQVNIDANHTSRCSFSEKATGKQHASFGWDEKWNKFSTSHCSQYFVNSHQHTTLLFSLSKPVTSTGCST
jgi:hypothetical protein